MGFPLRKEQPLISDAYTDETVSEDIHAREVEQILIQIKKQKNNIEKKHTELDRALHKLKSTRARLDYINAQLQIAVKSDLISKSVH